MAPQSDIFIKIREQYQNGGVRRKSPGRLSKLNHWLTIISMFLAFHTVYLTGLSAAAEREFPDWDQGVYAEINRRHGEKAAERMIDVVQLIKVHLNDPVETKLEAVNEYLNQLTWIADSELWKQPDYWATPFETITTFGGDCEDIAIGKYLVLRLMGVPDDHLGFAHVITSKKEHHMVLLYKASDKEPALVLDNQVPDIKTAPERPDLLAVYIFRNDGTTFIIKNEGGAKRSVTAKIENKRLEKWLTAKERSRKNAASYVPFNGGRPLAPSWVTKSE